VQIAACSNEVTDLGGDEQVVAWNQFPADEIIQRLADRRLAANVVSVWRYPSSMADFTAAIATTCPPEH